LETLAVLKFVFNRQQFAMKGNIIQPALTEQSILHHCAVAGLPKKS
jgi:hypothetical protein